MSGRTSIEWTDRNWPFARGCQRVSPGCQNCYAERMAARFSDPGLWAHGYAERTAAGPRWTGRVDLMPGELLAPLRVRKPSRFFPSTIDPFHEGLSFHQIAAAFGVMAAAPDHTFQILTKRAERMREFFAWAAREDRVGGGVNTCVTAMYGIDEVNTYLTRGDAGKACLGEGEYDYLITDPPDWPLLNVWLGVSVENQQRADERIPLLLQTPAAVHWVSAEPLLGPVDLTRYLHESNCEYGGYDNLPCVCGEPLEGRVDWVVVGGESGPRARPMDEDWVRSLRDQCGSAGVPFFYKQRLVNGKKVGTPELDGRTWVEFPEVRA